jgi:hypothetical protein
MYGWSESTKGCGAATAHSTRSASVAAAAAITAADRM